MTLPAAPSTALIRFSHHYAKLNAVGPDLSAVLLDVLPVALDRLSPHFLGYDTDNGRYRLPKSGSYLLLLLYGTNGLFTTLRRRTAEKDRYYRSLIGRRLAVVVDSSLEPK